MEQIARDPRADFLAVYSNTIKRDGAAAMLYWLDSKTDFFTAPASSKHHLAQRVQAAAILLIIAERHPMT